MADKRFDAWTRLFVSSSARRVAVKALAGGAAVALLVRPGVPGAIQQAAGKKRCRRGKKRCGRRCIPKTDCCTTANCPTGWECRDGRCVVLAGSCPSGDYDCSPSTVNCGVGALCFCASTPTGVRCTERFGGSNCGDCNSDQDCVDLGFGADSFCRIGSLCCQPTGIGGCRIPCVRCLGNDDCPTGCSCVEGATTGDFNDFCVVDAETCGATCAQHSECARAELCVSNPGCGFTCRRRCGA